MIYTWNLLDGVNASNHVAKIFRISPVARNSLVVSQSTVSCKLLSMRSLTKSCLLCNCYSRDIAVACTVSVSHIRRTKYSIRRVNLSLLCSVV